MVALWPTHMPCALMWTTPRLMPLQHKHYSSPMLSSYPCIKAGRPSDTGLNSIPPMRESHPNGLHAVQTRIFSYSLCSEK